MGGPKSPCANILSLGELGVGYVTRYIDLQLAHREAETVQRVLGSLFERRAALSDGRFVQRPPDVVRCLLERDGGWAI